MTSPPTQTSQYLHALRRFWWLLVVGAIAAVIAAIAAVYRIDFGAIPPGLEKRAEITYTASARLLVTSEEAPFFRTTVPREIPGDDTGGTTTVIQGTAPDIGTLVTTANLYPVLIESDEVQEIRREEHGSLPGLVTARAIYAVNSPSRFELSQVPVVELFAQSNTYAGAVRLARATVDAFLTYVEQSQDRAGLEERERILVEPIHRPSTAVATGGSSLSLPFLLVAVVLAAFVILAILLDRILPDGVPARGSLRSVFGRNGASDEGGLEPEPTADPEATKPAEGRTRL